MEVNAINKQFHLSFLQEWEEDVYIQAFLRQLEKEQIAYEQIAYETEPTRALQISSIGF